MFCFTDLLIKQTISHHPLSGRSTVPRPRHLGRPPGPRAPGQCPQWKHRVEKSTPEPVIVYGPRPPHWPQVGPLGADMSPRPLSVWSSPTSDLWSSSWSPHTIGAFSVSSVWRSVHSAQPIVHWVSRAGHIWRHPVQSQRSNISHRQLQQCYVPQDWRYDGRGVEKCLRKMRNISLFLCSSSIWSINK